jgi:DNA-3-methyladenine glycosylase II
LTKKTLLEGAEQLAQRDCGLAQVLEQFGPPPLLRRPATFGTLIHIILEQQVSVESAKSTFDRLVAAVDRNVEPLALQKLGETGLRELGFSRQKTRYALALANDCLAGQFNIASLSRKTDDDVRQQITARLGLGNWSADVFMMTALLRPDVLPVGDLGLVKGMEEIDEAEYGTADEVIRRAESWRPLRSIATRMVWQAYVATRGRDIF